MTLLIMLAVVVSVVIVVASGLWVAAALVKAVSTHKPTSERHGGGTGAKPQA